jgi:DNA-binding XRE family transcriptional regulator
MEAAMKIDGSKVRALREKKSWSQEHLPTASGLSVRTVQRVEREGGSLPETRLALAAALGVDASELAMGVPQKPSPIHDRAAVASGVRKGWIGWGLGVTGAVAGILLGNPADAPLALGVVGALAGVSAAMIGVLAERARRQQVD